MLQKILRLGLLLLLVTAPNFTPQALHFWQKQINRLAAMLP